MNSNQDNLENLPVSQDTERDSQTEVWEPPFERWLRIADSLLRNAAISQFDVPPRPQRFAPVHRG
jgi:hypothetical protein